MGRVDELVSSEFAAWEQRGRGWDLWPEPVLPEPGFREFTGYRLVESQQDDDSKRPGLLASLFDSFATRRMETAHEVSEEAPEPEVHDEPLDIEFVISLPRDLKVPAESLAGFVSSLHSCLDPVAFEIVGEHASVRLQFAATSRDAHLVKRQLESFFPSVAFTPVRAELSLAWNSIDGENLIVEFGLAHEFMMPLQTGRAVDPFVGLVAVLNDLQVNELAAFQVVFQPTRHPWTKSVWRSVTDENGKALFINKLQLIPGTKEKLESPLFGVVLRAAAKAEKFERASEVVRDLAYALRAYTRPEWNHLIPLQNDGYASGAHEEDLTHRQSRRSGMLLNREELIGFVHFPSDEVRSPMLLRERTRTKKAPATVSTGILLGYNRHAGQTAEVRLAPEQRVQHMHVIGASGTGKSTFLLNLIQQDIETGAGIGVIDPHGDLIERVLECIPGNRIDDVVLLDATDEEYSVGFNILSAHADFEKTLLASDLVSIFRRLSSSWGDQLNSVLNNAILAFLESKKGGTLSDLQRFLVDPRYRTSFLETVTDPDIVYYWTDAFPHLGGNRSIGPVITRLNAFLAPKPIRYMVSQTTNRLDFAQMLDQGKIFLAKLSKGIIGEENAFLLGSLLVTKFQQVAMSRQRLNIEQRRDYWLYLDECHNFVTASMGEILSGARKYRLGLVLAHQDLRQLQTDPKIASAVISNPATRICFRVGDDDARKLSDGFSFFEARDLQNLEIGEAICRVQRSDFDFNLSIQVPSKLVSKATLRREEVVTASRKKYATPRAQIEAALEETRTERQARPKQAPSSTGPSAATALAPTSVTSPISMPVRPTMPAAIEIPPVTAEASLRLAQRESASEREREPAVPRDLGRGGAQHTAIEGRIRKAAFELGFGARPEKECLDGSVDLLLARDGRTIACEIGVTGTVDHEVGNVIKCIKAGFHTIAVISIEESRLKKMRAAVKGSLGAEAAKSVGYYQPDEFIEWLRTIERPPGFEAVVERRGYKIKRSVVALSPEEQRRRESEAIRTIAESMRRTKS